MKVPDRPTVADMASRLRRLGLGPGSELANQQELAEFSQAEPKDQLDILRTALGQEHRKVCVTLKPAPDGILAPVSFNIEQQFDVPGRDITATKSLQLPTNNLSESQKRSLWEELFSSGGAEVSLERTGKASNLFAFCCKALSVDEKAPTRPALEEFCQQHSGLFPEPLTEAMWAHSKSPAVALQTLRIATKSAEPASFDGKQWASEELGVNLDRHELSPTQYDRVFLATAEAEQYVPQGLQELLKGHAHRMSTEDLVWTVEAFRDLIALDTTHQGLPRTSPLKTFSPAPKEAFRNGIEDRLSCLSSEMLREAGGKTGLTGYKREILDRVAQQHPNVAREMARVESAISKEVSEMAAPRRPRRRVASPQATIRCLERQLGPQFTGLGARPEIVCNLKEFLAFGKEKLAKEPSQTASQLYQAYLDDSPVVEMYRGLAVTPQDKAKILEKGMDSGKVRYESSREATQLGLGSVDLHEVIERHMGNWKESPLMSLSPDPDMAAMVARGGLQNEEQEVWLFRLAMPKALMYESSPQESLAFTWISPDHIEDTEMRGRGYELYIPPSLRPAWDR